MKLKAKIFHKKHDENKKHPLVINILKGVLISLCFSLVGILLFAFILKFTNISEGVITPINQIIKGVSIFFGVMFALKKQRETGLVSGLLIGLLYTLVAFVVFSVLSGSFHFDVTLLTDCVFACIIGAICGIICVNIKKSSV